ncbi:hypothetical protein Bhyg_04252 [Pseudolycoriella hygida]|uniref:Uncharacterized protein n=1 Tax=Pseudolycoriella hygida TaxID=35572 RepID=A0A9Q0NF32_9DIPT|nr:hypothetical protein Bhyg_04252 [Pseudolycoriella hygida]
MLWDMKKYREYSEAPEYLDLAQNFKKDGRRLIVKTNNEKWRVDDVNRTSFIRYSGSGVQNCFACEEYKRANADYDNYHTNPTPQVEERQDENEQGERSGVKRRYVEDDWD